MKFHALSLCLAGTLAASGAMAEDHRKDHRMHNDRMHSDATVTNETVDRSSYPRVKANYTRNNWRMKRGHTFTQEFPYFKENATAYGPITEVIPDRIAFYTDLPPLSEVARKISDIHHHNAMEAAEVAALASRARALGWTNIAAVYDQIAADHGRGATMAANWLTDNRFPVPAMPTTATVADMSDTDIRNSVDKQIDMHVRMYNETTDKLHAEKSSTVRGMYIMQLTTIARHIDMLEMLDADVERGRRDLSNRLASMLDATRTTRTASEWDRMIIEEEWSLTRSTFPTVASAPYWVPADAEIRIVERPVIVERVVERPATVLATPATSVEVQPVISAPAPQTTVAGRRETRARRPARRPAK